MRIATWNINGVRRRLGPLARLVAHARPDVISLQETKVEDDLFPRAAVEELGYRFNLIHGMKSYNGVAILSRVPIEDTGTRAWCGREDRRYAFATLPSGIEVHNCYVPSGGDMPDAEANDKFAHKLRFLKELAVWWSAESKRRRAVLVGDLNVAPLETDVWSHKQLLAVVSHTPVEVELLDRLMATRRWVDAVRQFVPPEQHLYTWWSYRNRDWAKSDRGRRLDHIWVTPALRASLAGATVLREARGWKDASDHVPVLVDLKP